MGDKFTLSGTPTIAKNYNFTLAVKDKYGATKEKNFTVKIFDTDNKDTDNKDTKQNNNINPNNSINGPINIHLNVTNNLNSGEDDGGIVSYLLDIAKGRGGWISVVIGFILLLRGFSLLRKK